MEEIGLEEKKTGRLLRLRVIVGLIACVDTGNELFSHDVSLPELCPSLGNRESALNLILVRF